MDSQNQRIINEDESVILKASDISSKLNCAESTIRKYSSELLKNGYKFERDLNGSRIYRLADERAFFELIRLRKESGVSLSMAAKLVASQQGEVGDRSISEEVIQSTRQEMEIRAFQAMQGKLLEEMAQFKKEILAEIQSQTPVKQIESPELLEENSRLKDAIEELKQELAEIKEAPKKSFWKRLFN